MGRKSNAKAERRALRPPPAIAETVARIEKRMTAMDERCPRWRETLDHIVAHPPLTWPTWCLIPMSGPLGVATHWIPDDIFQAAVVSAEMTALYTWSKGKTVYRFDPDLAEAILTTALPDTLPTDLFYRLPAWGIYVEAPQIAQWPTDVLGFFVHLEFDSKSGEPELRLYVERSSGDGTAVPLHLAESSLHAMLQSAVGVARNNAIHFDSDSERSRAIEMAASAANIDGYAAWLWPMVACVIYLCTDDADVVEATSPSRTRGTQAAHPTPGARQRDVGYRIGAALRLNIAQSPTGDGSGEAAGRHVAPHLRRAHWHHFWRGSRSDPSKRELVVKWLPPIPVNIDNGDIVPVVRSVR